MNGKAKYMRPSECRSHMRRTLAKEFQGIVDGFVEAAKKGSCPHVKLATELLKPIRKGPRERKERRLSTGRCCSEKTEKKSN